MDTKATLIWDFPTRIFHWTLAAAIATSFLSVRNDMMDIHFKAGGVVVFLILFRIIWGVVGSETAQFHRFFPTPARLRDWKSGGIGHSPLGTLSVLLMIGLIGLQASLGLITDDEIYLTGPLRSYVSSNAAFAATQYHAILSKVVFWLIILHLIAIAFYTVVKKSDLLKVFLSGRRKGAVRSIEPRPWYYAVVTGVLSALPVLWIFA